MAAWTVREEALPELLAAGPFSRRFISARTGRGSAYVAMSAERLDIDLRSSRSSTSIKPFYLPSRELVATYGNGSRGTTTDVAERQRLLIGARACDLRARAYLDRVFDTPPASDPFYQAYREAQVIISVDCVEPHDTCFCTIVGGRPYATDGFDINLTPLDGKYVLEVGSDAGRDLITGISDALGAATSDELAQRDRLREEVTRRVEAANRDFVPRRLPEQAMAEQEDSEVWEVQGAGCVECGACTQICPTCHCFYLVDRQRDEQSFERSRAWDSCLWSGYSRMAGPAEHKPNPRSRFRHRFANRFLHKYLWSPKQYDTLGCVGCGRCIESCPGRIDIRKVVREVSA